jgi:Leucine Rich Repeat.
MCCILIPLISCAGLDSLDSLNLGHNQLKVVPAKVFSHLTLLNSLELDGNHITHIDPEAFVGLEGMYYQVLVSQSYRPA